MVHSRQHIPVGLLLHYFIQTKMIRSGKFKSFRYVKIKKPLILWQITFGFPTQASLAEWKSFLLPYFMIQLQKSRIHNKADIPATIYMWKHSPFAMVFSDTKESFEKSQYAPRQKEDGIIPSSFLSSIIRYDMRDCPCDQRILRFKICFPMWTLSA